MDKDQSKNYETEFTKKVRAGKRRTYYFDVRKTKGDDYYITLTELTRRYDGGGKSRHKLFLYKEDFNQFVRALQESVDYVKTELMPDFDYDSYDYGDEDETYTPDNDSESSSDEDEDLSW